MDSKYFLVRPKEDSVFVNPSTNETFSLRNVAELINSPSDDSQREGFLKMGINITETHFVVSFSEKGSCYSNPKGDRTKVESSISEDKFNLRLPLINSRPPSRLSVQIDLHPFVQDGVNFIGKVTCQSIDGSMRVIPMTGTGTAALEGRPADNHAGFCTGGACASFQQRAAILLAIATAAGVREANYELFALRLESVNEKYHGRTDILDYTVQCASTDILESYFEFMKKRYEQREAPAMLKSYLDGRGPIDAYYTKLESRFEKLELESERQLWESKKAGNKPLKKTDVNAEEDTPSSSSFVLNIAMVVGAIFVGGLAFYFAFRGN